MRGFVRFVVYLCVALVLVAAYLLLIYEPPIGPIPQPQRESFDPALIERSAQLAAIGSDGVGHTVKIFEIGKPISIGRSSSRAAVIGPAEGRTGWRSRQDDGSLVVALSSPAAG